MATALFLSLVLIADSSSPKPNTESYVVLCQAGEQDAFRPAAAALAKFHRAELLDFDSANLTAAFETLKAKQPKFVVFVLPPEKIDVELVHQILERSTNLDSDIFCDFEFGFVTGRDGAAALRFVENIKKAWSREYGRTAAMFGSWEGPVVPKPKKLSALEALRMTGAMHLISSKLDDVTRAKNVREILPKLNDKDALLFFSHGYPDQMVGCFRGNELSDWQVNLGPAVLINCACYNGATGKWYEPAMGGPRAREPVAPRDCVALGILDSGVPAYFGGIDPWHGPLAFQLFGYVADDGMRLGEAAKRMYDRLAIDFLPNRIHFEPVATNKQRFSGEGSNNRRHNGAGMIFFGDPSFAPFAKTASKRVTARWQHSPNAASHIIVDAKPLVEGMLSEDFIVAQHRLIDYYSVKTSDFLNELRMEAYAVLKVQQSIPQPVTLSVQSARVKGKETRTANFAAQTPMSITETFAGEQFLHVRVPIDISMKAPMLSFPLYLSGFQIDLLVEDTPGGARRP